MKITDATDVVRLIKAVKGDLELDVTRKAMPRTDLAIATFQDCLRDEITEAEMAAALSEKLNKAGGRLVMPVLAFGERSKLPHGLPARHPIKNNEPPLIECGGAKSGYSVGVYRGAVVGRHPETEALHDVAPERLRSPRSNQVSLQVRSTPPRARLSSEPDVSRPFAVGPDTQLAPDGRASR